MDLEDSFDLGVNSGGLEYICDQVSRSKMTLSINQLSFIDWRCTLPADKVKAKVKLHSIVTVAARAAIASFNSRNYGSNALLPLEG